MKNLKMASLADCETANDFYQYYNGGFLALRDSSQLRRISHTLDFPIAPKGLLPIVINDRESPTLFRCSPVCFDGKRGIYGESITVSWDDLAFAGSFGRPMLGNIPFLDSYMCLWDFARRESFKGLRINWLASWAPDKKTAFKLVLKKNHVSPALVDPSACPTVAWNIYNPTFDDWGPSVELLTSGKKVGVALTEKIGLYFDASKPHIQMSYRHKTIGHLKSPNTLIFPNEFKHFREIVANHVPDYVKIRIAE